MYGPRQDPHGEAGVVAIFARRLLSGQPARINGDGRQTRDFLYIEDVCRAVERALSASKPGVYHLGTGQETSVNELVRSVERVVGTRVKVERQPARAGDASRSFVDLSAARRTLRWSPRIGLEEGLARTLAWMRAEAPGAQ